MSESFGEHTGMKIRGWRDPVTLVGFEATGGPGDGALLGYPGMTQPCLVPEIVGEEYLTTLESLYVEAGITTKRVYYDRRGK